MFDRDSQNVYRAESLKRLDWLEHGFGTIRAEPAQYGALRALCASSWPPEPLVTVRQIHSNRVIVAAAAREIPDQEGDALITDYPGVWIGVRTADCLPILIADSRRRAVAAVHAGWRGTVQEIGLAALAALRDKFGSRPEDLVVAIGPGIGACCYEVGVDVAGQFQKYFPERADLNGSAKIDLTVANVRQFVSAGVPGEQISVCGLCTQCAVGELHSYRRDGARAGRMTAAISVRPG
ncbi:MAG: peptidoglycan editing factor PgeF [Bryobacteraceae bacterium]